MLVRTAKARKCANRLALRRSLRPGRYTVELAATARGYISVATAALRVR